MADDVTLPVALPEVIATDEIGGRHFQRVKIAHGADGTATDTTTASPLPVGVQGTVPVSGPLTDAELRAAPVPVTGTVTVTDGSGPVTIDAPSLPLPNGAATEVTLAALNAKVPPAGQAVMAQSQPVAIASNQSPVPTLEAATILTGQAAQTAVVNNILESVAGASGTDVANIRAASVQVISTGTGGTFIFEQSNDGTNWRPLPVFNAELTTGASITAAITATVSQIIYTFPVRARFLRLRIATTITGGSIQAISRLSTEPWTAAAQLIANPTGGNLAVSGTVGVTGYPTAAASGDAFANPTVTKIDALGLLFNGTTWDRARNNNNVVVETSTARTATGTGTTQTNFNARGLFVWVNVTAVTGTTPTLTVRIQWSPDGGTTWLDLDATNAQTASITATGAAVLRVYPGIATAANASLNMALPRTWRLAWTIGGTTPSFTFAAQASYIC